MQPAWTGSWDVLFRSSQQCSALLALAPVGAGKPTLSFPGLLDLMSSLSDLKALQNCAFKSDVVCVLPGAGLASDLNSAKKLFSVLPMWIVFLCGCVPQQWRQKVSLHCWAQPFGWSYEIWWRILMPVCKKGTRARDFNIHKLSWGTSLLRFYSLSWHLASCAVLRLLFKTI